MQILVINAEAASITRTEVSNRLNIIANQYVGKTSWPSSFGSQCYSFAHFVFNTVFERSTTVGSYSKGTEYKFNVPASDVKIVGCLAPGYTDAQLEAFLDLAQPGDYVQLKRRTGSAGAHSEIVLNVDPQANTITILDANSGSISNQVRIYTQNYFVDSNVKSFRNWNQGVTIYRYKDYQVDVNNPFGSLDSVTTDVGKIAVHGWAADMDEPNGAIWVHFYTVKDGNREWLGAVQAGDYRPDICKYYPGLGEYHGFNAIFNTNVDGDIQVEAHGINVGDNGSNLMLSYSPKSVSVPKDTFSPTISNVEITERSASGYTIICTVDDNVEISKVRFPTWTANNWQDDIIWHEGEISGNRVSCRINTSEHNNEIDCEYLTHIYAWDECGNGSEGYGILEYRLQ